MKTKLLALVVACTGTLLVSTMMLAAQEPKPSAPAGTKPEGTKPASTAPTKPEGTKPAATKPAPKKPGDGVTAIVGGDVYTVSREIIRGGTVMFKDGKITAVGLDLPIPEGATVIDAKGKFITPGFVAISTNNLALRAGAGGRGGAGGGIGGGRQDRFADQLNPFDRNLKFCLGVGITTANVEVDAGGGGRGRRNVDEMADDDFRICPCCGMTYLPTEPITPPVPTERQPRRSAVIKLTYGDLGPMLLKENPFYHLPASSLAGSLNRTQWREAIKRARQAQRDADSGDDEGGDLGGGGFPRAGGADTGLRALVKKEIPLRTEASNVDTLRDMIALAKELDYRLIVDEVVEGWVVPKELAEAGVSVIYTPRNRRAPRPGREDNSGSSIESSRVFEEAGVPFSVSSLGSSVSLDGIAGRDLMSLPLEAAFAVRGGCTEQAALAALTIVPAKQLGLEARIGSIDVGKDADLLILDGPPLDYRTYVEKALVGGKCYYDRTKDRIYPDTPAK